MRVGIYGGSFDPFHLGHLNLIISIQEIHGLDEVWTIPSYRSPFKEETSVSSFNRIEMVKLGTEGIPFIKCLDNEVKKERQVFTIETLRELKELYPETIFYLIMGDDLIPQIHKWKEIDEVFTLAKPLIGSRMLTPIKCEPLYQNIINQGLTKTPYFEISATEIRLRLSKGLCCKHLLPLKVLDYICQNQLYY